MHGVHLSQFWLLLFPSILACVRLRACDYCCDKISYSVYVFSVRESVAVTDKMKPLECRFDFLWNLIDFPRHPIQSQWDVELEHKSANRSKTLA